MRPWMTTAVVLLAVQLVAIGATGSTTAGGDDDCEAPVFAPVHDSGGDAAVDIEHGDIDGGGEVYTGADHDGGGAAITAFDTDGDEDGGADILQHLADNDDQDRDDQDPVNWQERKMSEWGPV